jgi:hypothetical protein
LLVLVLVLVLLPPSRPAASIDGERLGVIGFDRGVVVGMCARARGHVRARSCEWPRSWSID